MGADYYEVCKLLSENIRFGRDRHLCGGSERGICPTFGRQIEEIEALKSHVSLVLI